MSQPIDCGKEFRQVINRIGGIPIVGSAVGLIRAPIALIAMVAIAALGLIVAFFMAVGALFTKNCWSWDVMEKFGTAFCRATQHFFVGLAEIIPGIGSSVHYAMNEASNEGYWSWKSGGCCDDCDWCNDF